MILIMFLGEAFYNLHDLALEMHRIKGKARQG